MRRMFYLITFLLLALLAAVYSFGPYSIIRPIRSDCPDISRDSAIEAIEVEGHGGIKLDGYWYHVANPRATILLLHGVGSCKEVWRPISEWLAKIGIESLAFDNRGHGRSGGEFTTFGFYEKEDVKKIIDFKVARDSAAAMSESTASTPQETPTTTKSSPPPIGIFGNSLGGAISLQTMAIDERIRFGIIESTFTRLDEVVFGYMKRLSGGWGFKFVSDLLLHRAGKIADFNPDLVRPVEAAAGIHQPIFLAHGDADIHIPVANAQLNFDKLASTDKELVIVPGADHSGLNAANGGAYEQKMLAFIERQLKKD